MRDHMTPVAPLLPEEERYCRLSAFSLLNQEFRAGSGFWHAQATARRRSISFRRSSAVPEHVEGGNPVRRAVRWVGLNVLGSLTSRCEIMPSRGNPLVRRLVDTAVPHVHRRRGRGRRRSRPDRHGRRQLTRLALAARLLDERLEDFVSECRE